MINLYETALQQAKTTVLKNKAEPPENCIDIEWALKDLLYANNWSELQSSFFHGWMKKMDVAKTQYLFYQPNWKLSENKIKIDQQILQLSALMAMRMLTQEYGGEKLDGQFLKTCNALFKILERLENVFTVPCNHIAVELSTLLNGYQPQAVSVTPRYPGFETTTEVKTLPITVLFSEGPIARAYLETIRALGCKVKKVIRMVSQFDLVSKKPVGGLLPQSMKANYAANKQYKQMFYWPNQYLKKNSSAVKRIQEEIHEQFDFTSATQQRASVKVDLETYAEAVETVFIEGLNDQKLLLQIQTENSGIFLYTGGGIVPDQLMSIAGKQLIHIHPGFLPDIKGADCVLWSQLLTRNLSASAFFMAPGIDVGDVILPCWLPAVKLNFPKHLSVQAAYRMVYAFLDPWVRAYVLRELIHKHVEFENIKATPQESTGITYHFMHAQFKKMALSQFK